MKNFLKILMGIGWVILACLVIFFFLEAVSLSPDCELQPATVRKVVPNAKGFFSADQMTLIRFDDGYDTEIAGPRGEPGDHILALRQKGTLSMFGLLGDRSYFRGKF